CREQIVYQGLKRTNSTTEDFECACRLCGYVAGCSPQRAEQFLLRPEAFIQDGQVELNLLQGIRAGFERLYATMDRCRGRISGITLPAWRPRAGALDDIGINTKPVVEQAHRRFVAPGEGIQYFVRSAVRIDA